MQNDDVLFIHYLLCNIPQLGTANVQIKVRFAESREPSKGLSFMLKVGQNIDLNASPTAGNFLPLIFAFPANSSPFDPNPLQTK